MVWIWVVGAIFFLFGLMAFSGAPYVPSKRGDVKIAFTELYPLSKKDTLVDIGSGDGIVLREAARHGAKAIGFELNPVLVAISKLMSRGEARVETRLANFWTARMPLDTTVVYTFGDSRDIKKMYAKVENHARAAKKHIAFITYGFDVPGIGPTRSIGAHHLYIVKPLQSEQP